MRDQRVQFKICDIYHPDPTQVLLDLHGDDLLTGKVVDLSDSGMHREAFAVVEVDRDYRTGDRSSRAYSQGLLNDTGGA